MTDYKNEDVLADKLTRLGFSQTESNIYIYLLKRGVELGGSKISIGTGIHRQYIYLAIPRLIEAGLVEKISHGKQSKYKACHPQIIETIGRNKAMLAGDLAKELNLISSIGNEQDFEVLQGQRAIQEYEILRAEQAENEELECIIGGASDSFSKIMDDLLPEYLDIKKRKNIQTKYLGAEGERDFYEQYMGKSPNQHYRFIKKLPMGKTNMLIRSESVSFYTFLSPPLVYIVKSKQIADHYRAFFEMLWEMGEE